MSPRIVEAVFGGVFNNGPNDGYITLCLWAADEKDYAAPPQVRRRNALQPVEYPGPLSSLGEALNILAGLDPDLDDVVKADLVEPGLTYPLSSSSRSKGFMNAITPIAAARNTSAMVNFQFISTACYRRLHHTNIASMSMIMGGTNQLDHLIKSRSRWLTTNSLNGMSLGLIEISS